MYVCNGHPHQSNSPAHRPFQVWPFRSKRSPAPALSACDSSTLFTTGANTPPAHTHPRRTCLWQQRQQRR
eukprot:364115-Chlamydomonas_euryale.AAC.7